MKTHENLTENLEKALEWGTVKCRGEWWGEFVSEVDELSEV
jgi:hypothetical protein